jgi:hypothetical protein
MERVASPSQGRRMPCPAPHASQQPNCSTLTNPTQLPRRTPLRRAARAGAAADGHGAGAMAGEQWGYGARTLGVRVLHSLAASVLCSLIPLSSFFFQLCLPRYLHLHLHFPPSFGTSCMPCIHLNVAHAAIAQNQAHTAISVPAESFRSPIDSAPALEQWANCALFVLYHPHLGRSPLFTGFLGILLPHFRFCGCYPGSSLPSLFPYCSIFGQG